MVTFAEFLENAASRREFVNVLFEERVFELIGTLQALSVPLDQAAFRTSLWEVLPSICTWRMPIPLILR